MKVVIGSDHGGFSMKVDIRELVVQLGHDVKDVGCFTSESVHYPDFAEEVCQKIISGEAETGILICGTGIGMSMVANRYRQIRAALCHDHYTAAMSREHNNANVLCLGERVVGIGVAEEIVRTWFATGFADGRHQQRIQMFSG